MSASSSNAAEPGLTHYPQEIRRFPMLERQEEYRLAKRWREHGDRNAAHKLVTSHLRLGGIRSRELCYKVNFILAGVQYYTDSSTDLHLGGPIVDLEILPISPAPALGFSFPMSVLLLPD